MKILIQWGIYNWDLLTALPWQYRWWCFASDSVNTMAHICVEQCVNWVSSTENTAALLKDGIPGDEFVWTSRGQWFSFSEWKDIKPDEIHRQMCSLCYCKHPGYV